MWVATRAVFWVRMQRRHASRRGLVGSRGIRHASGPPERGLREGCLWGGTTHGCGLRRPDEAALSAVLALAYPLLPLAVGRRFLSKAAATPTVTAAAAGAVAAASRAPTCGCGCHHTDPPSSSSLSPPPRPPTPLLTRGSRPARGAAAAAANTTAAAFVPPRREKVAPCGQPLCMPPLWWLLIGGRELPGAAVKLSWSTVRAACSARTSAPLA